jgi:ABC-type branched-subunit amino acid transport system ATPase component/ABC-type branched-subunit amino acid transport system permease subunit
MFVGQTRTTYLAIAGFTAAYLLVIFFTRNSYYQLMLTLVPIWAILGLSWNLLSGYSGLISFGHAAFFGLGAFTTALLFTLFNVTPWIGIPLAGVVGSLAGLLIGAITFRLRGHYFALAMLAYPLAMLHVFEWAGYQEVSLPMKRVNAAAFLQFADQRWYALITLGLLIVALLLSVRIERSRFGLSLLAIKQNELAAEAAGIPSLNWKLKAIAASGAFAGVAGGLYAVVLLVVTPESGFGLATSAQALIVTMFGGVGTVWGPVVGSVILIPLAEILQAQLGAKIPGIQGVIYGIAIILVIMRMPQGIVWALKDKFGKKTQRTQPVALVTESHAPLSFVLGPKLLEVRKVFRSFGGVKALSDISVSVRSREILGIIGPNGAGKTTLFNVMNGLVPPSRGDIRFQDVDLVARKPSAICALGIGRTFQVTRPFLRMTVLENVIVGAFVRAKSDAEAADAARRAIARVGLGALEEIPASELTNYELRLMELARATSSSPVLLLLDEPFAGLATAEIESYMNLIRGFRADGLTIVIIEHTMHAMIKLVDRFVVLDHGVVIADGNPRDVVKNPEVIKAYLGDKWVPDAQAQ